MNWWMLGAASRMITELIGDGRGTVGPDDSDPRPRPVTS